MDLSIPVLKILLLAEGLTGLIALPSCEKCFHLCQVFGSTVRWQTIKKNPAVALLQEPVIEQRQHAAVLHRADQPPKSLLERYHCRGNLVLKKCISSGRVNRPYPRRNHRIIWHRKRQPVNDHAAQLFALNVHTLPKRSSSKQHRVGREAELFQ